MGGGAPARPGAGGHGLWPVSGTTHIRVPAATGKEREGERRQAGGAAHGIGHIRQRNEERGRENGRWIRLRFN
jgi:hypothetical protein